MSCPRHQKAVLRWNHNKEEFIRNRDLARRFLAKEKHGELAEGWALSAIQRGIGRHHAIDFRRRTVDGICTYMATAAATGLDTAHHRDTVQDLKLEPDSVHSVDQHIRF